VSVPLSCHEDRIGNDPTDRVEHDLALVSPRNVSPDPAALHVPSARGEGCQLPDPTPPETWVVGSGSWYPRKRRERRAVGQGFVEVRVKEKKESGEDLEKDKHGKRKRRRRFSKGRTIRMSERNSETRKRLFLMDSGRCSD
jgi:hypothetical protein